MARSSSDTTASRECHLYIGGHWEPTEESFPAENPATGETIASIAAGTREDVGHALEAARAVQPELQSMTAFERAALVHDMADAIEDGADELADWLTRDQGKPLEPDAVTEIELAVEMFRGAAEDVKRAETPVIPAENPDKRVVTLREPHGVYGVITPWNFPITIPSEYIAPGIAAGNAIVWVPAPTTSAVSARVMELLAAADLPAGTLNMVTGEGPVVGDELVGHDLTDAVGFTGSPQTGEQVARNAGAKPTLLELGGNGPVIVLEDADVDRAAEQAASGCFGNAGQICTASERILVHESIREEFVGKVRAHAADVEVGDPMAADTDMGPLNNADVAAKMDAHVEDAVAAGGELLYGGNRLPAAGSDLFYEPTVIDNVPTDTEVNRAETFGPIAPIIPFESHEEAIEIANSIDLGLSSGIFTESVSTMWHFAEQIETGMVNINEGSAFWEIHTPTGGYSGTDSGVGRIGGRFTLEEMTQLKNVIIDVS